MRFNFLLRNIFKRKLNCLSCRRRYGWIKNRIYFRDLHRIQIQSGLDLRLN